MEQLLYYANEYLMLPLLPLFVLVGSIFFNCKTRFFILFRTKNIIKVLFRKNERDGISPFAAVTVALAGTLGVGNIVGVAVAISVGGAGAIFWMWASALFCMILKYAEIVLSIRFRHSKIENGARSYYGGPMYYIKEGLKKPKTAAFFAVLCLLNSVCVGSVIQINSVSRAFEKTYGIPPLAVGIVVAVLCAVIVLGGIKMISDFTVRAIPLMSILFLALSLLAISMRLREVPSVLAEIFHSAFSFRSAVGGFAGAAVMTAIKQGMAKGVLTHEAGSGTAPISHASANTDSPVEQGFWGIFEVFVDTILLCTVTAIVILLAQRKMSFSNPYDGIGIAIDAYSMFFGSFAAHFITISILFFAFATIICWSFYGISCAQYLFKRPIYTKIYLILYCASIIGGSLITPKIMWEISDFFTCFMTILNTTCVILLSKYVTEPTQAYFVQNCQKPKFYRKSIDNLPKHRYNQNR